MTNPQFNGILHKNIAMPGVEQDGFAIVFHQVLQAMFG
jgi:hypothetical protein